jgi:hypothetical protein
MSEPITTADAATEGTGKNTGASDGADNKSAAGNEAPTAAPVLFTAEQEAFIGQKLKEEREREREAARKANERAQQKEQERVAEEQGKFKEVADQRAARIAELEAQAVERERQLLIARVQARHKLPDEIASRLVGTTEAELDADAKKLAAMLVPPKAPDNEAGAGNKPTGAPRAPSAPTPPADGNKQPAYSWQSPGDVRW